MLFQVAMTIRIPHDSDQAKIKQLSVQETEMARKLQHDGRWRHIGASRANGRASVSSTLPTQLSCMRY